MSDFVEDLLKNSQEPEWMEKPVLGSIRAWQLIFLAASGVITFIVILCCCIRLRVPRTKQQIEADYQRRKITNKFRQELEKIQDAKMDTMSLKDALELLHSESKSEMDSDNHPGSQGSSLLSHQHSSIDASFRPDGAQKPEPQVSGGMSFVKFASKVAHLNKFTQPKSPTSPTPSSNIKMDF